MSEGPFRSIPHNGPPQGKLWLGEPDLGGWYTEEELEAVNVAIRESMDWTVGFKPHDEIREFEQEFADYVGSKYALAINGAGTGLDMIMKSLCLEQGDEVISCALNFPGTHLSIIGHGGKIVLAEPDPQTLNILPEDLERKLTKRTRAVVVTHMNGLSADMDAIEDVVLRNPHPRFGPIKIVVDAARACGASYRNRKVGSQGHATVFSFQRKKLMTTLGEGGMIVCDDYQTWSELDAMRSFGKGFTWGTNYKLTKVQAAVGRVQLRRLDSMNDERIKRAIERTKMLETQTFCELPCEPTGYRHVYYLYCIILPRILHGEGRGQIIKNMRESFALECKIANGPTYKENDLIARHTTGQLLHVAEDIGGRVICLPLHPLMTQDQNQYICDSFIETVANVIKLY
jgi:perosamine synthetase